MAGEEAGSRIGRGGLSVGGWDVAPGPAVGAPAAFVEEAQRTFAEAAARAGLRTKGFRFGPYRAAMHFAGPAMERLFTRAIGHLEASAESPDLTVSYFDSESTGVAMPAPPWGRDVYLASGEIKGFNTDQVKIHFRLGFDILECIDIARSCGVYWTPTFRNVPYWEQSFPMRPMINWWLQDRALQPIHAGAVGVAEGGLLITGPSGSGKTTTTLACLDSDLFYAGDDYVLASLDPEPYVYSLYCTAKIEPANLFRFPHLEPFVTNRERLAEEKALVYVPEYNERKMIAGFPIRGIVIPRVTGQRDTFVRPARPADALLALAPTTTRHLSGTGPQTVRKLFELIRRIPAYELHAGTDLRQIPRAILSLLGGHR